MHQHKVPLYLEQEDKFMLSMTPRQLLILVVGGTLAYALFPVAFDELGMLRLASSILVIVVTLPMAFVRFRHRDPEQWGLVALLYISQPKIFLWHPACETIAPDLGTDQARPSNIYEEERDEWEH